MNQHVTPRHWGGFVAMVVGMFMAILDIQIVASSLKDIQAGLSASADEISWIQTSYLIAEVVMIPLTGYVARLLSTRVLFTISAGGFAISSLLCALAWDLNSMVIFRAIQGFIGGSMIPVTFAASFLMFPREWRNNISVLMGLVATMAPTIGPSLGGWITEGTSWHWLFLINLVPGIAVAAVVWTCIDIDKPNRALLKGIDILGFALMAVFLGCLEYVLEEGPRDDWMQDDLLRLLAIVAAVSAIGFFWRMFSYKNPIVDLRAFADRNFALGCLYSFIIGVGMYGIVYVMPLFLAQVRGYNALQIGEVMFVTGVFQFLSAPIAGRAAHVLDPRAMLILGLVLFGSGVYLQSQLTADWGFWEFFLPQAVRGLALMFLFMPVNIMALGTLPPERLQNASGLYNLMRNLGGAIGLAGINTIMQDRLALHWLRLVENLTPGNPNMRAFLERAGDGFSIGLGEAGDSAAVKLLARMVRHQADVLTFSDVLLLMALVFFASVALIPLLRKPRPAPKSSGAH
ncbi:MAG TPA: DHA2 family efflux MFS transporter permease subunit [Dongiaceae bacterium]|nr:DHA2 family efflux MFS transporter permease subunit [Dongiaceae bacterium]